MLLLAGFLDIARRFGVKDVALATAGGGAHLHRQSLDVRAAKLNTEKSPEP